jgi:hypothetical protein
MLAAFAILVEFTVKPGQADRFRKLVVANAEQSLRDEPGCRRFDVLDDPADPQRIVLYEIYSGALQILRRGGRKPGRSQVDPAADPGQRNAGAHRIRQSNIPKQRQFEIGDCVLTEV